MDAISTQEIIRMGLDRGPGHPLRVRRERGKEIGFGEEIIQTHRRKTSSFGNRMTRFVPGTWLHADSCSS